MEHNHKQIIMYQGNWKCSGCGGEITELPFQPRSEAGLTCRTCWSKSKNNEAPAAPEMAAAADEMTEMPPADATVAGEPAPTDGAPSGSVPVAPGEKPKFEGDWKCAGCGAAITSLPFEPRNTDNLKCIDCFKASKA